MILEASNEWWTQVYAADHLLVSWLSPQKKGLTVEGSSMDKAVQWRRLLPRGH